MVTPWAPEWKVPEGYARRALEAIAAMRAGLISRGEWPNESVAVWRGLADEARGRMERDEPLEWRHFHALQLFPAVSESTP